MSGADIREYPYPGAVAQAIGVLVQRLQAVEARLDRLEAQWDERRQVEERDR